MDTPPISATATIRRVESSLPAERHDNDQHDGRHQPAGAAHQPDRHGDRNMQPHHGEQDLAGGVAQHGQVITTGIALGAHSQSPKPYFETQAATACGSMASQAPASRSRSSPSCPSGRTTSSDGIAVALTIAAPAEAAAVMACSAPHQGGKATATTSAP